MPDTVSLVKIDMYMLLLNLSCTRAGRQCRGCHPNDLGTPTAAPDLRHRQFWPHHTGPFMAIVGQSGTRLCVHKALKQFSYTGYNYAM